MYSGVGDVHVAAADFLDPDTVRDDVDPAGERADGGLARVLPSRLDD